VTSLGQTVRDKLKQAHERLEAGAPVRDATRTVGDWLAQWRTTTLAASGRKESMRELSTVSTVGWALVARLGTHLAQQGVTSITCSGRA